MPQKFIHDVSPELTHEAAYKNFASIESHALTQGSTIRFLPGTYEMGTVTFDGINIEGLGAKESIVLCNTVATLANTVTVRNVTFSGNNASIPGTAGAALYLTNASNALSTLKAEGVIFTNADFGVDSQGLSTLSFNRIDATAVDRFLRSNSVVAANVAFSMMNNTANAYFTGANATLKVIQIRASYAGASASNTGNTTRTITANVA